MPEFDPNQPYETVKPEFDPDKPFEEVKPERGALQRAFEETAEHFTGGIKAGVEAVKRPFTMPTSVVEAARRLSPNPVEHIKPLLAPVLQTLTAPAAGVESLIASGMAAAAPSGDKIVTPPSLTDVMKGELSSKEAPARTSEERYQYFRPGVSQAMFAMRPAAPGSAGFITGKGKPYPQTSPEWEAATKKVPPSGNEAAAGSVLRKGIEEGAIQTGKDPAAAVQAVEQKLAQPTPDIVPGSKPTTFQLTEDPGLGQLETVAAGARNVPAFRTRQAEQNKARLDALEKAGGTGSPQEIADHLTAAMRGDTAAADANYAVAEQLARDAATQLGGTFDYTTYGNVLRREIMQAEQAARANERMLWERVNPDGTLRANPQPLQELERRIYGGMTDAATESLMPDELKLMRLIQSYRPVIRFQELTDLRSLTSDAIRAERRANGETGAFRRLVQLRQGIEDTLTQSVFDENAQRAAQAAQQVQAASAATRQRAETFNIKPIRDVTRREGAEQFRMGETSVPRAIVKPGPEGYDTASRYFRAVGNERGLPDVTDAVAADLRRSGVIGENGVVNPTKLQTWMRQREGVLRAIDERDGGAFRQRLSNAETASRAITDAEAAREAAQAAHASADLRKLTGAVSDEHIADIIGNVFNKVDSVPRAQDLARRLTTPASREGAQRAIVDWIHKRLISNTPAGEGNLIRADQFQTFIHRNRGALSQFLTPEQISSLEGIAQDINRMNRSQQTKARGVSPTVQLAYNLEQQQTWLKHVMDMVVKQGIGRVPFIGKASKAAYPWVIEAIRSGKVKRIQAAVDRGLLDPEYAAQLLQASKPVPKRRTGAAAAADLTATGGARSEEQRPRATGGDVSTRSSTRVLSPGQTTPAGGRQTRPRSSEALSDGGATGEQQPVGEGRVEAMRNATVAQGPWGGQLAGRLRPIKAGQAPKGMSRQDIADVMKAKGLATTGWEAQLARGGKVVKLLADGGGVGGDEEPNIDSRVNVKDPPLPDPGDYLPERVAARVRRRHPVREPNPISAILSSGKGPGVLDVIGGAEEEAAKAARGEDFRPLPLLFSGMGVAGAPLVGPAQRGAVLGSGAIRRAAEPTKKATASLGLRDMPMEQAIEAAKTERHIIPTNPNVREGYVGAPAWVKTPEDLAKMRADFDTQVEAGMGGADWYQRAQSGIKEMAGPDPARQHLLSQQKALTSAQATPDTNLGFALQGHNAIQTGKPLPIVRTGQISEAMQKGQTGEIPLGKKTGIYARHMDPTMEDPSTGTNDIWHARAFGYRDPKTGEPWDKALTMQQHAFMDAETLLAVARANAKRLGGRSDWTAGEVQAAPWVALKARGLQEQFGWSPEKAMEEATKTYPDFFSKYTAYGTHEATPGIGTGHLPKVAQGTEAERAAFAADPRSSWRDPSGRDIIYQGLGMWTRPSIKSTGIYEGPAGLEINPAEVARPMVSFTGKAGERAVDPASRRLMDAAEAARAYVDAQNAGAWSKPITGQKTGVSTSAYAQRPGGGPLPIEDVGKLQAIGGKHGLPGVIDYGEGTALTSFGGGPTGKQLGRSTLPQEVEGVLGVRPQQAKLDTGYIDYQSLWQKGEGSGAVTRELQKYLLSKDSPAILKNLDASQDLRQAVLARIDRDAEIARQTGQPIRADLQRARTIIANSGFSGLFRALSRGAALPAMAFVPLVEILREQQSGE